MPRWLKILSVVLVLILILAAATALWIHRTLTGSLPALDGELEVAGLAEAVSIERDALGVPTLRGENRLDLARALGFLHGQERFFQMDLMRRRAAGELAELFGAPALGVDRAARVHQFRRRAARVVEGQSRRHREIMMAYTEGINSGLRALGEKPVEYVLLRLEPEPWLEEDSVLVVLAMYFTLNGGSVAGESTRGLLRDLLPEEMAAFLSPPGTEWDAPVVGEAFTTPPIPAAVSALAGPVPASEMRFESNELEEQALAGSNNWAVAGSRTAHGRAILANDMHLGMAVPNTWYRVMLEWPGGDGCGSRHRMVGVTLPGSPAVIVGSNTRVAWGFTNSQGDWSDLVIVETDPEDSDRYRTSDGYREFESHTESITVRDGETEGLDIRSTIWGPIIDHDHLDRPRAQRWIAHDAEAVNLGLVDLEHVATVREAQEVANRTGIPPQNFVVVDAEGSIGWTIVGRIPRRVGFSGHTPESWADGTRSWEGWLDAEEYPRIIDPVDGLIWTANARVVDGEMLKILGDGGYVLGARAQQIRDHLRELDQPDEAMMLAVQLDDRALFLEPWRDLVIEILGDEAVARHPNRKRFRDLVLDTWTGRASVDSAAYRLVRAFRSFTFEKVYGRLTAPCEAADERFSIHRIGQWEGPLWRMVTEQPEHLADPDYGSWSDLLLGVVDSTIEYFDNETGASLEERTWGERNTLMMQHPLSRAVPTLSGWLDMPREPLPGDSKMPRMQSPGWGASERLAVSPGHEEDGYFHMPGGQSGHPMSPHYRAGHEAWTKGDLTPLLPGPTETVLTLLPPVE
jgi:penicillin amidase